MKNLAHFLFGQGWMTVLYVAFYLFVISPVLWTTAEVPGIYMSQEFTGPGYGTWAGFSLFFTIWALFVSFIITMIVIGRKRQLTWVKGTIYCIAFIVFCRYIIFSDSYLSDPAEFLFIVLMSILSVAAGFVSLWLLQSTIYMENNSIDTIKP